MKQENSGGVWHHPNFLYLFKEKALLKDNVDFKPTLIGAEGTKTPRTACTWSGNQQPGLTEPRNK
ncbi:hypothetical protein [Bacillus salipaludis]|uniref:Uncharacterized protein n=1 Tax=Bacillus salipaludis TaxID=2547811 RepID=A0AA90R7M5_9BACI|nr:hypothetical protein [Bacillus salipaludis]MDQ6597576.1 hypothetical protein [Bacillus salipaludis]